nr:MAG TPA: hypothetical protein [Caudoviricetes sp.]
MKHKKTLLELHISTLKFLLLLIILCLVSCCTRIEYSHPKVSQQYLEPCPMPKRYGNKNKGLVEYTVSLYENLKKCNADKEAIKKELDQ